MCFIQTLVITTITSDILAKIDQKGPNLTFPTLKNYLLIDFRASKACYSINVTSKMQQNWVALWHCRTVSDSVTENAKSD